MSSKISISNILLSDTSYSSISLILFARKFFFNLSRPLIPLSYNLFHYPSHNSVASTPTFYAFFSTTVEDTAMPRCALDPILSPLLLLSFLSSIMNFSFSTWFLPTTYERVLAPSLFQIYFLWTPPIPPATRAPFPCSPSWQNLSTVVITCNL